MDERIHSEKKTFYRGRSKVSLKYFELNGSGSELSVRWGREHYYPASLKIRRVLVTRLLIGQLHLLRSLPFEETRSPTPYSLP